MSPFDEALRIAERAYDEAVQRLAVEQGRFEQASKEVPRAKADLDAVVRVREMMIADGKRAGSEAIAP